MISHTYAFVIILVTGAITMLLRMAPLYIWTGDRKIPEYVLWLGKILPYAIMMMLCVFALKGVSFNAGDVAGFGSSSANASSWDYSANPELFNNMHDFIYRNSGWFPPLVGVVVTGGVCVWKKNTMWAIILGTLAYMAMVYFV